MFRAGIVLACLFTASIAQAATITAKPTGGRWESAATWVGDVVPSPTDDVRLDATSGNVIMRYTQFCRSLDCTGYTGTLWLNSGYYLLVGYYAEPAGPAVVFSPTMTLNALPWSTIYMNAPGSGLHGIETGGHVMPTVMGYGIELLDDFAGVDNGIYAFGDFFTNNHDVTTTALWIYEGAIADLGTSQINCGAFEANPLSAVLAYQADITIGSGYNFFSASHEFNTVKFVRGQTYEIRGSSSFTSIELAGASAATTIKFQGGNTTQLTGANPLPSGDASGQVTLCGVPNYEDWYNPPVSTWTLFKADGFVLPDYVTISDSSATGGATYQAGPNSIDDGDNTGWGF